MPYIKQETREAILNGARPENAGQLNFIFSTIINQYMLEHGLCYQTINDIRGAVENALSEWYARVVLPYETLKIQENGDVYSKEVLSGGAYEQRPTVQHSSVRPGGEPTPLDGSDDSQPSGTGSAGGSCSVYGVP